MFSKLYNWLKSNFSRVKFYDIVLWKNYLAVIGTISSIVTIVSFFVTAQKLEGNINNLVVLFVALLLLVCIFILMWWDANHLKNVKLRINNTNIEIKEGDIFDLLKKDPKDRIDEISVIGVNDFYDSIVDDRIIAKGTVHGRYIDMITQCGKLDDLNKTIEEDEILNKVGNWEKDIGRMKGKKIRYSIGSIVEYESYVLTAFTKFDEKNKAYLSAEEYMRFWMCFWENIDEIYAGRTINIPLMGAGIARFRNGKPSKQELLESILWSLKISGFHNTYGNKNINILIYKSDIKDIDFYHIQHNQSFK